MIMNPWPILGAAARDNNDDCDDEDSAGTRGLRGHQAQWSRDTLVNQSGQRFLMLPLKENRLPVREDK